MTAAAEERAALCELFAEIGPDAPTLCGDWTTRDLAAHLVVRERRPDAAIGIVAKPFAAYGDRIRRGEATQPWDDLVARVRSGPPIWSPTHLDVFDRLANTVEFFVHHEDVRRARPTWTPRNLHPTLTRDLAHALKRMAVLLGRRAPCGLVLDVTDAPTPDTERIVAKKGEPSVIGRGAVGEVVLFLYGRGDHARVELIGPDDLVAAVRATRFGI
jgi:uncharacterized protein (TIGR03085 family)